MTVCASRNIVVRLLLLLWIVACAKKETPSAVRGKEAMQRYGCVACHRIPGVQAPAGMVGPPLDHMASKAILAGKFPNTPDTMSRWLQNPQAMDPASTMPNLNVTPDDARDMTAYMGTLK